MGIPVRCPHGHEFRVKDNYAGKTGICPFYPGRVAVRVPDALSSPDLRAAYEHAVGEVRPAAGPHGLPSLGDSSIFAHASDPPSSSASGSLLGSSILRHTLRCTCGESAPMWYAKCPKCGAFLEHS